jgi:hypothetical protein
MNSKLRLDKFFKSD